jgi:Transposase zinc-ribbon domain
MVQRPGPLPELEARFPEDAACARWLFGQRWPQGLRCPGCGHDEGWELGRGTLLIECARCRRQTSVTAGTVLHRSHLPLGLWFLAAWLVATRRNGISARQLWLQLGPGSYKTAWLLLQKLRRAMVDPGREPLAGLVEVDETSIPLRAKDEPVAAGPGRAHEGKLLSRARARARARSRSRARARVGRGSP